MPFTVGLTHCVSCRMIYLGYEMANKDAPFVSKDGTSWGYVNWYSNRPDGADNSEYCIGLRSDGKWEDEFCLWHYPKYWVCKKPVGGKYRAVVGLRQRRRLGVRYTVLRYLCLATTFTQSQTTGGEWKWSAVREGVRIHADTNCCFTGLRPHHCTKPSPPPPTVNQA